MSKAKSDQGHAGLTHQKKGNPAHDKPGYHQTGYGSHRLNLGAHRLDYTHKPCINHSCKSYGQKHPNCKCYAKGGVVNHFCSKDSMHQAGCEYYAQGGAVNGFTNDASSKGLNLSKFKKLKEDKKTVTMGHPDGHSITILKSQISPLHRKQMENLPIYLADGTDDAEVPSQQDVQSSIAAATPDLEKAIGPQASSYSDTQAPPVAEDHSKEIYSTNPVGRMIATEPAPSNTVNTQDAAVAATPTKAKAAQAEPSAMDSYSKELKGINAQAVAASGLAKNTEEIERQHQEDIQRAQSNWEESSQGMQKNINDALVDIKNGHIDPNHYQENQSTGQKVATAIGLLLGGFSGGFSRTGVNPAANWLNEQINRDVDAQKANLNKKATVYNAYLDQYKNASVADQLSRATQAGIYASKLREAAAKAGTPAAQAMALTEAGKLEGTIVPLINHAHLIDKLSAFNGTSSNGQVGSEGQFKVALNAAQTIDPAIYADMQSKYVPSVGYASHPMAEGDREKLANLNSLKPKIDEAIAFQETHGGYFGTNLSKHPIEYAAKAKSIMDELTPLLGRQTELSGLRGKIYENYQNQIGKVGGVNLGGTLETLKNLKGTTDSDYNSAIKSAGINHFSDAKASSGLTQQQEQNLNTFLQNPNNSKKYKNDQGLAIQVLKEKGLL